MKLVVELSPLSFVTQLCTQQLLKSICGLLGVTQHLIDYLLCNAGHQIYFKRRRKKRKYNLNILVAQWTRVPNRCWVRLVCLYHIYLPRSQAFPNCALVVGGLERGLPRARPPFFPPCYFVSFLLLLQKEVTGNEAVIAHRNGIAGVIGIRIPFALGSSGDHIPWSVPVVLMLWVQESSSYTGDSNSDFCCDLTV